MFPAVLSSHPRLTRPLCEQSGDRSGASGDSGTADTFREIILLGEYEELSQQEIADVLDCPVGTVMSRLGRARAKLRELLSETLERSDSPSVRGSNEGL